MLTGIVIVVPFMRDVNLYQQDARLVNVITLLASVNAAGAFTGAERLRR